MRIIAPWILCCCLVPVATAYADSGVAVVDDEPTSRVAAIEHQPPVAIERHAPAGVEHRTPADVGELRSARVTAPGAVDVDDGTVSREHEVAAPHTVDGAATSSDLQAELAAHQMRRLERPLAACVAAAVKRTPSTAGHSLTLDFDVADRKVRSVSVSDDSAHDPSLAACLTSTARAFRFSLASARFRWPVAIR